MTTFKWCYFNTTTLETWVYKLPILLIAPSRYLELNQNQWYNTTRRTWFNIPELSGQQLQNTHGCLLSHCSTVQSPLTPGTEQLVVILHRGDT